MMPLLSNNKLEFLTRQIYNLDLKMVLVPVYIDLILKIIKGRVGKAGCGRGRQETSFPTLLFYVAKLCLQKT